MPSGIRWAAYVAASLALAGCASNDLMVKRQTETEAKVEHLIQSDKKAEQRMNELSGQVQSQEDQAKAVGAQLKELQDTIRELRTAQDELKARISLQAAPKIEASTRSPPPGARITVLLPTMSRHSASIAPTAFRPPSRRSKRFSRTTPKAAMPPMPSIGSANATIACPGLPRRATPSKRLWTIIPKAPRLRMRF